MNSKAQAKRIIQAYIDFSQKIKVLRKGQQKLLQELKRHFDGKELEKVRRSLTEK